MPSPGASRRGSALLLRVHPQAPHGTADKYTASSIAGVGQLGAQGMGGVSQGRGWREPRGGWTSTLPLQSQALGLLRDAGSSFGSLDSQLGAISATAPSGLGKLDSIR